MARDIQGWRADRPRHALALREVAEGRIKLQMLAQPNQDSLKLILNSDNMSDPDVADNYASLSDEGKVSFRRNHASLITMSKKILSDPQISQTMTEEAVSVMKRFVARADPSFDIPD